ncbi:MAG: DUF167 domain-containing protein [Candidatus Woesearchaeota archaeon]|jgi:uncharacterized protein (TIGR00251 family)
MDIQTIIVHNKIHVLAKPNAHKTELLTIDPIQKIAKIALNAPPDKDKANKELLHFMSKLLKKQVRFVSGLKSKNKILEILD